MDDALRATIELMQVDKSLLDPAISSYNIGGLNFTPKEITAAIQKTIPNFETKYQPDHRQAIADSWPDSIDDTKARKDWNWNPQYDLEKMCIEMITQLKKKYSAQMSEATPKV